MFRASASEYTNGEVSFRGRPQFGCRESQPELTRIVLPYEDLHFPARWTDTITGSFTNRDSGRRTVFEVACEFPSAARAFDRSIGQSLVDRNPFKMVNIEMYRVIGEESGQIPAVEMEMWLIFGR
jgi:hypothetical protein